MKGNLRKEPQCLHGFGHYARRSGVANGEQWGVYKLRHEDKEMFSVLSWAASVIDFNTYFVVEALKSN